MRVYKQGDRVQVTRYYLMRRQRADGYQKTEVTCGVYVGPAPVPRGCKPVEYVFVDWITGKEYPPTHRQSMKLSNIEPYGTPR